MLEWVVFWNIERSPGVRLTRHQSKSAVAHRYDVAVDLVRDLRPACGSAVGWQCPGRWRPQCDAEIVRDIYEDVLPCS